MNIYIYLYIYIYIYIYIFSIIQASIESKNVFDISPLECNIS